MAIEGSDDHGSPAAWIRTVAWQDATDTLRDAYDWQAERLGAPTEFTQLGSLAPELVLTRLRLYRAVERVASDLSPLERRMAAFVTSSVNGTPHCSSGLRIQLRHLAVDEALIERAASTPAALASSDARLDAIARYAAVLAANPGEVRAEDIDELRDHGLADLDLVDLNGIVAYYAYINRVANGLGLRTELGGQHALGAVPR